MRCALCARRLTRIEGGCFVCGSGHHPSRAQLVQTAAEHVDGSLWSLIRALETEVEVTRFPGGEDGSALEERAQQAERDACLLRRLATARRAGTSGEVAACGRASSATRAVSRFLVAEASLGDTLRRIAELARDTFVGSGTVSIALFDEKERLYTAVSAGAFSQEVDELQYEHGEGPIIDAFRQRLPMRIDDTRVPGAWPAYRRHAVAGGILSSLALPLVAAGDACGTLNLYAGSTGAFLDEDAEAFTEFATQVAVLVTNARAYWRAFDLSESLRQAMAARWVIEQAKGIIIATNGCSSDEAFEILVRASQRENVKLRDIARRIVRHHSDEAKRPPSASA